MSPTHMQYQLHQAAPRMVLSTPMMPRTQGHLHQWHELMTMRVLFLMVDVPRMVLSPTAAGLILSLAVAVPKTVPRMVLSPTLAGPKGFWAWEEG